MQLYNRSIEAVESLNFIYSLLQACSTHNCTEGTMKVLWE